MNNNVNIEERKNNGQGIFYAVIGVATLVVTIVGATFAYFSASANSNVNAIAAESATLSLGFSEVVTGLKHNLIPMDETDPLFKNEPGTDCLDINNNEVCSVYQFTISNPSGTTAQRVYATLKPQANNFVHLNYAIFKGSVADVHATTNKFKVDGTAVTTVSDSRNHIVGATGDMVAKGQFQNGSTDAITLGTLEQVLPKNGSMTYTIVLWIHETGGNQTTEDSGKSFAGSINFTTEGDNTGVTGVLSAS